MSQVNFCGFCGVRNVSQAGTVQRFCVSCGKSFTGGSVIPPVKVAPTPQRQSFKPKNRYQTEEDDEELEFPDGLPELKASDVVIEGRVNRFEKIGELGKFAEIDGPRVKNPQEISPEAFKESWKKDAGSSRERVSVEIGE